MKSFHNSAAANEEHNTGNQLVSKQDASNKLSGFRIGSTRKKHEPFIRTNRPVSCMSDVNDKDVKRSFFISINSKYYHVQSPAEKPHLTEVFLTVNYLEKLGRSRNITICQLPLFMRL